MPPASTAIATPRPRATTPAIAAPACHSAAEHSRHAKPAAYDGHRLPKTGTGLTGPGNIEQDRDHLVLTLVTMRGRIGREEPAVASLELVSSSRPPPGRRSAVAAAWRRP